MVEVEYRDDWCDDCIKIERGIPTPHLDYGDVIISRKKKIERLKGEKTKERREEKIAFEGREYALQRVREAEARGDYAGELQGCPNCKSIINKNVGYCVRCENLPETKLRRAGIPLPSPKPPTLPGYEFTPLRGVPFDDNAK